MSDPSLTLFANEDGETQQLHSFSLLASFDSTYDVSYADIPIGMG